MLKSSINTTKRIPNVNKKRNTCDVVKTFNLSYCRICFGLSLAKCLPRILKIVLQSYGITEKACASTVLYTVCLRRHYDDPM